MSTLTISVRQKGGTDVQNQLTLTLDGNLDNSTLAEMESKLTPALAARPAVLTFDLARLKYITSVGIRVFFSAMKQQKQHGGHLCFINLQPQIKEVFALMGEVPDIRIFSNQAELDTYLLARQKTHQT